MVGTVKTSVIIPTYNGAHRILNVLHALRLQRIPPDEIIVVVDGSTDNTLAVLDENVLHFPGLRIINQTNGGRAKVRNRGAREAGNELLIFFDDDMRPLADCVEVHIQHHLKHPQSILTGGLKEEIVSGSSDIRCFKSALSEKWNQQLVDYADIPMPEESAFLTAANFSIAKSTWDRIGGFDERLNDAEDYDLAVRAAQSGIPMYYNIAAFAWHDDTVTCKNYIKRLRQYRVAQEQLQRIKPEVYHANHKYAVVLPGGLKGLLFKSFCFPFWIKSVDSDLWKKILPMKARYKLYDWIITANGAYFTDRVKL